MPSQSAILFRENVKQILDERGMTITEFAEQVGTSRPSMSRILSGEDGVTIDRAERIAIALNLPLRKLLSENRKILSVSR